MAKIAHVCTSAVSHRILADKLELLRQEGHDVYLISSREGLEFRNTEQTKLKLRFVPMNRDIRPLDDLASIWRLWRLFRRERFDIVHTHTAKAGVLGRVAAWAAGVRIVLHTSHGLPFFEGQPPKTYRLYRALERIGARFCDALSSQNREDMDKLRELAPGKPVYWEGNGVDLEKVTEERDKLSGMTVPLLRAAYELPEHSPVLLVGARFEPVKGHRLLLEALRLLKKEDKLRFVTLLAGSGPLEDELRRQVLEQGLEEDVRFIGHPTPLYDHLELADAVALTSDKEGIPRIVMEAMAFGKPVVATDALGTREVVRHGVTGELVPLGRADLLAEALTRVMSDAGLRWTMGENGREVLEASFTEQRVVERLGDMYAELERLMSFRKGRRLRTFAKRTMDLAVSVPALLLLAPVMGIVALLVSRYLGSPVLFRQERPGLRGQPFTLYKFRTMTDERDEAGRLLPDDRRLTSLGRLLRKLSLDELPQLINVVKGEMSLIGPRPLLMEYLPLYTAEQSLRHEVKPGITGWAQVNGRNALSWEDKFRMDVWYAERQSFALDMRILLQTVRKVARSEGISQEGHDTVSKFTGSPAMAGADTVVLRRFGGWREERLQRTGGEQRL